MPSLSRLRKACLALPEATEKEAWGSPTFRVKNKLFAMYAEAGNHHGDGQEAVWIKATPMDQSVLVRSDPKRFFVPAYVGPSGWVGVVLNSRTRWGELGELLKDAWRLTATKTLRKKHQL